MNTILLWEKQQWITILHKTKKFGELRKLSEYAEGFPLNLLLCVPNSKHYVFYELNKA